MSGSNDEAPDLELSWQTFLGNQPRPPLNTEFVIARSAYIASWYASRAYAARSAPKAPIPLASKTVTVDRELFAEAINFVDRHSESWYRSGQDLLARLRAAQHVETTRDAEDAAKWRALRNCARIKLMGAAGLTDEAGLARPDGHVGLEFWTHHQATGDAQDIQGRDYLDRFIAKAMRQSPPKTSDQSSGRIEKQEPLT